MSIAEMGGVALAGGAVALGGGAAASYILSRKPAAAPEISLLKELKAITAATEHKSFPLSENIQDALGKRTTLIKEIIEKSENRTLTRDAVNIYGQRFAEIHASLGKGTLQFMRENNDEKTLAQGVFMHTGMVSSVDSMLEKMLAAEMAAVVSPQDAAVAQEAFQQTYGQFHLFSTAMDDLRQLLKPAGDRSEIAATLNDFVAPEFPAKVREIIKGFKAEDYPPAFRMQTNLSLDSTIREIKGIDEGAKSALETARELLDRFLSQRETSLKDLYAYVSSPEAVIAGTNGPNTEVLDLFGGFRQANDRASGMVESFQATFEPYLTPEMSKYLKTVRTEVITSEDTITKHIKKRELIDVEKAFKENPGMELRAKLAIAGGSGIPDKLFKDVIEGTEMQQRITDTVSEGAGGIPLSDINAGARFERGAAVEAAVASIKNIEKNTSAIEKNTLTITEELITDL